MVTILRNGRYQMTIKGKDATPAWEALVKEAAKRANLPICSWIVQVTTCAACAEPEASETELLRREIEAMARIIAELHQRQDRILDHLEQITRRQRRR